MAALDLSSRSSRLWRTVSERAASAAESSPQMIPRAVAIGEETPLKPMPVARRGISSNAQTKVIVGTIMGPVGLVTIIVCSILLVRYFKHRKVKAAAPPEVTARPIQFVYQSGQKPVTEVPPPLPPPLPPKPPQPKPTYNPERIPNHPYASQYAEDAEDVEDPGSLPQRQPSTSSRTKARNPHQASSPRSTSSHPYSIPRSHDDSSRPPNSPHLSERTYESFMSPLSPSPEPPGPDHSPETSAAGGIESSTHNRAGSFSNATVETGGSHSSSSPLQPRLAYRR